MADIFISYSKAHRSLTEELALDLQAIGFSVWWDTELFSGENFRNTVMAELTAAKAAVVIWSAASVKSDWVISEASRARARGVLIPVRDAELNPNDIPPPFDVLHTELASNRTAIITALAKLGLNPSAGISLGTVIEAMAAGYWRAIKASTDPQVLREFLDEFGMSRAANLARDRLKELASVPANSARMIDTSKGIVLEISGVETGENPRRSLVHFRCQNNTDEKIAVFKLDTVVFDANGVLLDRIIFDMAPLRANGSVVRTFPIAKVQDSSRVGALLVNEIVEASPNSPDTYMDVLTTVSRVPNVQFRK